MKIAKTFISALLFILYSGAVFCAVEGKLSALEGLGSAEVPAVKIPEGKAAGLKEWTVMIYMSAKNDLEKAAITDINEMEFAGSSDKVNVVVEIGRTKQYDTSDGDWSGIRRYFITRDYFPQPGQDNSQALQQAASKINSPIVFRTSHADMGNYQRVGKFAQWVKQYYPARKYMLIIWNHGSGWADPKPDTIPRGISFDYASGNYIRTDQLGPMMKGVGGVDVLAMDACLMQQIEVAYEVKNYAKILVASEDVEPDLGYDYANLIGRLTYAPNLNAEGAAVAIVDTYGDFYQNTQAHLHKSGTQSAIRLDRLDNVMASLNNWADTAMRTTDPAALQRARAEVIRFDQFGNSDGEMKYTTYGDLFHFMELAGKYTSDPAVRQSATAVRVAAAQAILRNRFVGNNLIGKPYILARGIGISIPRVSMDAQAVSFDMQFETAYSQLNFSRASKWSQFFAWMNAMSRKEHPPF